MGTVGSNHSVYGRATAAAAAESAVPGIGVVGGVTAAAATSDAAGQAAHRRTARGAGAAEPAMTATVTRAASAADGGVAAEGNVAQGHLTAGGHEDAAAQSRAATTAADLGSGAGAASRTLGAHVGERQVVDLHQTLIDHEAALGAAAVKRVAIADDGQAGAGHQVDLIQCGGQGDRAGGGRQGDHVAGVDRGQVTAGREGGYISVELVLIGDSARSRIGDRAREVARYGQGGGPQRPGIAVAVRTGGRDRDRFGEGAAEHRRDSDCWGKIRLAGGKTGEGVQTAGGDVQRARAAGRGSDRAAQKVGEATGGVGDPQGDGVGGGERTQIQGEVVAVLGQGSAARKLGQTELSIVQEHTGYGDRCAGRRQVRERRVVTGQGEAGAVRDRAGVCRGQAEIKHAASTGL